jgi:hypothetical protein
MRDWVVRNGDWYLSQGPSWAVSTWSMSPVDATRFEQDEVYIVAQDARDRGYRPFGRPPSGARAVRAGER